jgi:hypothetical protein
MVQLNGGKVSGALKEVVARSGKRGLFGSLGAVYSAGVPYSVLLYGVYRPCKVATRAALFSGKRTSELTKQQAFLVDMVAASVAEIVGLVAFVPGELVAKRMMIDPTRYANVGSAMSSIIRTEGVKGLFTGFGTCLVRDVPYTCLQFALFDAAVERFFNEGPLKFRDSLAIGTCCAIVASTVTLPIDTAKSQVMLAADPSKGVSQIVRSFVAGSGKRALFRGYSTYTTINIAKWSSSQAVFNAIRGPHEDEH